MPDQVDIDNFRSRVRDLIGRRMPLAGAGVGTLAADETAEFIEQWRKVLYEERLLGAAWPSEYGGAGLSKREQIALTEECARVGLPVGAHGDLFSIKMLGNTLLKLGTDEQKRRLLPRILSGEDRWCQGFSEPDAGSDLAGVKTSARRVGEEWSISGQKIWTSGATEANWIFVLARTDPDAERHRGLSFLLCPLDQSGVEVRPIRMMSGRSEFCEVFFDDARTAPGNIVGQPGDGWKVAMTLFAHERGDDAGVHPIMFGHEFDRLAALVHARGAAAGPVQRDRLMRCYVKVAVMDLLGRRIVERVIADAGRMGPEVSVAKLYWSEYHKEVTALALDVLGAEALVLDGRPPTRPVRADDPDAPNSSASWVGAFFNSAAGTIYAGSSEIQRNILAESVLGLPRQ